MSATINFGTPLSETVGGSVNLDTTPQALPVSSVAVDTFRLDANSGTIVVTGTDNNGVPHSTRYAIDAASVTALKAGLAAHMQVVYPSNNVTVA